MEETITKYYCDQCKSEMNEWDYKMGPQVTIKVHMPNQKGGCGQVAGVNLVLCSTCAANFGIENKEDYHKYADSSGRLYNLVNKVKTNILDMFFKRTSSL
jgi:DNA-directed RNA polymerase subunit RPC12/RpoP